MFLHQSVLLFTVLGGCIPACIGARGLSAWGVVCLEGWCVPGGDVCPQGWLLGD